MLIGIEMKKKICSGIRSQGTEQVRHSIPRNSCIPFLVSRAGCGHKS